jgi:hypothetical protein
MLPAATLIAPRLAWPVAASLTRIALTFRDPPETFRRPSLTTAVRRRHSDDAHPGDADQPSLAFQLLSIHTDEASWDTGPAWQGVQYLRKGFLECWGLSSNRTASDVKEEGSAHISPNPH